MRVPVHYIVYARLRTAGIRPSVSAGLVERSSRSLSTKFKRALHSSDPTSPTWHASVRNSNHISSTGGRGIVFLQGDFACI